MNRIEFMTQLAALLQDISVEERKEAMQYYNDYFDDAGEENEKQVIIELGSPKKVAATIKADLGGVDTEAGEYTETGYTDSRFEKKETPAGRGAYYYDDQQTHTQNESQNNRILKIILIAALIIVGAPIVLPVVLTIAGIIFGITIVMFALFIALVAISVALVICGVSLFCVGVMNLVPALAIGFALMGVGLVLTVIGVIASVGSVRLCTVAFPGIFRGIVWLCRRPFQGRAVA